MAVTATRYGKAGAKLAAGSINYASDTIKVAMLTSSHTPNIDTHEFWSDVSANETSGTGYTAGGQALTNKSTTYIAADDATAHKADPTVWNASGGSLAGSFAVVYKDTGTASTSPLIGIVTFDPATMTASNANFTITWDATNGVFKV